MMSNFENGVWSGSIRHFREKKLNLREGSEKFYFYDERHLWTAPKRNMTAKKQNKNSERKAKQKKLCKKCKWKVGRHIGTCRAECMKSRLVY